MTKNHGIIFSGSLLKPVELSKIEIKNCGKDGINVNRRREVSNITIQDSSIQFVGLSAIYYNSRGYLKISNCTLHGGKINGLSVDGAAFVNLTNVILRRNERAIRLHYIKTSIITECTLEDNQGPKSRSTARTVDIQKASGDIVVSVLLDFYEFKIFTKIIL